MNLPAEPPSARVQPLTGQKSLLCEREVTPVGGKVAGEDGVPAVGRLAGGCTGGSGSGEAGAGWSAVGVWSVLGGPEIAGPEVLAGTEGWGDARVLMEIGVFSRCWGR